MVVEQHHFHVPGMDCPNESRVIGAALESCPGVQQVQFDLIRQRVTIVADVAQVSSSSLQAAIANSGFPAHPMDAAPQLPTAAHPAMTHSREIPLAALSAMLLLAGAMLEGDIPVPLWPQLHPARYLLGLSILLSARTFLPRAWNALRQRQADMNTLVALAAVGALLLGDWMEAALVTLLFAVAHLFEAASAARVRTSIEGFLSLMPSTAIRYLPGCDDTETVPAHLVCVHDLLLVRPGAHLPADGVVESGSSELDQSVLTGESLPLPVHPGSTVFAGSINGSGALRIRVRRPPSHSRAARLEQAIQQAQALRSPTERWVERFARVYTPMVIATAAVVAILPPLAGYDWREWFYHSLVLLLIACPCALVIATPVTMVSAISALARSGVLLRGGEAVERASQVRTIAFDKTGVLTQGDLELRQIAWMPDIPQLEFLRLASAIEMLSEHPAARAFVRYANRALPTANQPPPAASSFHALPGLGGEGVVNEIPVWVGSPLLAKQRGAWSIHAQQLVDRFSSVQASLIAAGSGNQLWLVAALGDSPRPEAHQAIQALAAKGLRRVLMLSGDHLAHCQAIANLVGIPYFKASLLPDEKLAAIRELESTLGPAAMVGDGMNDAPAMAAASFSIAAGSKASDLTLQAADAVIWDGDLRRIPFLFAHCRMSMSIVRQNVVFAVGSKAIFALLALLGLATLWMAVLADVGATLLVTANGLRLLRTLQPMEIDTSSAETAPSTSS